MSDQKQSAPALGAAQPGTAALPGAPAPSGAIPAVGPELPAMIAAIVALGPLTLSMYTPSMPAIARDLGASSSLVQATLSIYLVGFAVAQLAYGPLSDRYGRRRVLLGGLLVFVAGTAMCGFAQSIGSLLVGRLVQAAGACAGPVLGRAMVRDVYPREQGARVLAFVGMALAVAPALGPLAGGYLQVWFDWHAIFAALAAAGLMLLAFVALRVPETNLHPDRHALQARRVAANYRAVLSNPAFLGYTALASGTLGALFAYHSAAPFLLIDLVGVQAHHYGWLSMITVAGYGSGSFLATRIGHRLGIDRTLAVSAGFGIAGVGLFLALSLVLPAGVATIMGPVAIFTTGLGMGLPSAMAGALAPFPRIAGTAAGLMGFAQMGMGALGSVLSARLGVGSPVPVSVSLVLLVLSGCVPWYLLVWRRRGPR
jgi:MFS transporter, DHA1 family, multidrug resistance protein